VLPPPNTERVSAIEARCAYAARVPVLRALVVQLGAALLVLALAALVPAATRGDASATAWALAQGIIALRLARGLGMDPWWLPLNALFVPGLVWALGCGLPPAYALGAFLLLFSLYWGVARSRVPLFFSSRAALQAVADLLPREHGFAFLDLGCGLGGLLGSLARMCPQGRYYGVESAPLPYLISRLRALLAQRDCRIRWGDYRHLDFARYDIVYAYLSPAAMAELWVKARREMRPGSLLVSNQFAIPGVRPTARLAIDAHGNSSLLLWRM